MTRSARRITVVLVVAVAVFAGTAIVWSLRQPPAVRAVGEQVLREYTGVYQWDSQGFVYLQMWNELAGSNQLVAFDESGNVRTLYPTDADQFFAGPGAALPTSIESRVVFRREAGKLVSLTWQRDGAPARTARRVDVERHENLAFSNGAVRLAGTLIAPSTGGKPPAVILVHGSGPESREFMLPFARFLVRRGMAVFGYDKRGVGESTGDWKTASFDDLAGDVIAAFEHLKQRPDIDATQVGMLGVSQAGWIMPIAAVRAKGMAFLISVSGAGVSAAETTIDQARHEMTARGMPPQVVEQVVGLMTLQYEFARTGQGWEKYAAARAAMVARMGAAPETFPGSADDPYFQLIRRLYFYDPAPTLRQLQLPTLAIFGELDNNILADKNRAAWAAALEAGRHRDYTLRVLPRGNHLQLEAKVGSNAEMPSLQRFVPDYFTTINEWLAKRIRGFELR
jgi:pimeloyl-ACP methyl ester carboxylesterase